jgi:hypothetical protein
MRILFFSPHSAIWEHAFPEALVAEALLQNQNEIIYIGCGGLLNSYCIAMSGLGISHKANNSEKEAACRRCKKNNELIRKNFKFFGDDLSDVVELSDLTYVEEQVLLVTPANFLDFSIDGINLGRIALYEILLHAKKSSFDFTQDEWKRYQDSLRNSIMVLCCMKRIFDKTQPECLVVYNALYSVNRIACMLAESRGISQYFLHAGENLSKRLQTLMIDRGHNFLHYQYLRNKWLEIRQRPCAENALKSVTNHFLELMSGNSIFAYSSGVAGDIDLKNFFKIKDGQKVICATMSSYDEMFAAQALGVIPSDIKLLFHKQVDWIEALIEFVQNRRDLNLIIRVHPREFPNKREGLLSEHAIMLERILTNLPENVNVNWPNDNISIYDLAIIVDTFANAWSTAGEEMILLGIPVVLYSHDLVMYASDLNYVGTSRLEYFQKIESALNHGWNPERIRKAYRWAGMKLEYASLDISDSFTGTRHKGSSKTYRIFNKLRRIVFPDSVQNFSCRNRAAHLSSAEKINQIFHEELDSALDVNKQAIENNLFEETVCLKREVGRLVEGLVGSKEIKRQSLLIKNLMNFASS